MNTKKWYQKLFHPTIWGYGLFWSWNLIFLTFMTFGFAPMLMPNLILAVRLEVIPMMFALYAVILVLIPITAVILGATLLRRKPAKLLMLGYGVEGPLMLIIALRFFVIRDITPAIALLLIIGGLGMLTFLWQLLSTRRQGDKGTREEGTFEMEQQISILRYVRLIGLTFLLGVGLYAALWLAFYAVPVATFGLHGIWNIITHIPEIIRDLWVWFRNMVLYDLAWLPFSILSFLLMIFTGTLFVGLPLAVPILYIRAWRQEIQTFSAQKVAVGISLLVLIIASVGVVMLNQQPQAYAFDILAQSPKNSFEEQERLAQQDALRTGLLNAYLAPFRYISSVGEVDHISELYEDVVGFGTLGAARVQTWYETIARPLLYEPVNDVAIETGSPGILGGGWRTRRIEVESREAAELYEQFFDEPIEDGERATVLRAARATWSIEQAQTSLQMVDDREVLLTEQTLTLTEHDDWANVELYEVYENQTGERQEVVYYFNLPESAVLTGLWLGNSPNREERFVYRVAPRGAAQAVYRNEVRYNRDPALLEQIGPRQYRLRIFPIEPPEMAWEDDWRTRIASTPTMHLWMTWRVLADDGEWPMPRLSEKRNIFWDRRSIRTINGDVLTRQELDWLPATVPAATSAEPLPHRVDFANGHSIIVQPTTADNRPPLPNDFNPAIILDRSRSMDAYSEDVVHAWEHLIAINATADVYLTSSAYRGAEPARTTLAAIKPENIVYYGGQNAAELLAQYADLHTGEAYDAILVLTDGTGYDLATDDITVTIPTAPVWMVHLGGDLPLGYDDATLEAIQASGGGIAGDLGTALNRIATSLSATTNNRTTIVNGYTWHALPTSDLPTQWANLPSEEAFAPIAARYFILNEIARQRDNLNQLATLDDLHTIAIEHSIITPYSSMLVLVNERQEKLLDELEQDADRFAREVEDVGETEGLSVTGVPEPEEWALIIVGTLVLLGYAYYLQRQA